MPTFDLRVRNFEIILKFPADSLVTYRFNFHVFELRATFQACSPGIKHEVPVYGRTNVHILIYRLMHTCAHPEAIVYAST